MYYFAIDEMLCQTHDQDIAAMYGAYERTEFDTMNIDFGGALVTGMAYIEISLDGVNYSLLAHHLNNLVKALDSALGAAQKAHNSHIVIHGHPFYYAMKPESAEHLLKTIAQNWNEYRVLELSNLHVYERAIRSVDASKLDVSKEIASLRPSEVH